MKKTLKTISFTLIELLFVIAIIMILASLLLPALRSAREKSYQIVCMGNEKQVGFAIGMYLNDYGAILPHFDTWRSRDTLGQYIPTTKGSQIGYDYILCPSKNKTFDDQYPGSALHYTYNASLSLYSVLKLKNPTAILIDGVNSRLWWDPDKYFDPLEYSSCRVIYRHSDGANMLFTDGHVQWKKQFDIRGNRSTLLKP